MMIYIVFLFMFIAASFLDINKAQSAVKKVTAFYLMTIAVCFIGLRYYTGADWFGYMRYFNSVDWSDRKYGFGYKVLNILSRSIIDDYFFCQFLATCIFCIGIYRFFKRTSEYFFLSLFLAIVFYFSELFMAQVRQSLAIAVLLLGGRYLIEGRRIKYVACVLVATLFHATAVFALACLFLRLRLPKFLQIVGILLGFVLIRFPNVVIQFLLLLSNFVTGTYHDLIVGYLNSQKYNRVAELNSGLFFYGKQLLALLVIVLYKPKSGFDVIALNALIFSCLIRDASIAFFMLGRLEPYIGFYTIIGWTRLLDIRLVRENKSVFFMVFFLFVTFFAIPFCKDRTQHRVSNISGRDVQYQYVPYYNVFFHPEGAKRKDWCE